MAKWVLIIILDYHGTAIQKIEGFTSKDTCEYAASQIDQEQSWRYRLNKYCVEVK